MNESEAQEPVFALLADPRPMAERRSSASTPMRPRYSWPAPAPSRSSARCAFPSSTIRPSTSASRPARPSSRSTARSRRKSIAASCRSRAKPDGRLALDGAGTPVEWAVEMRRFDEKRPSTTSLRRAGSTPRWPTRSAAPWRRRTRRRPRSMPVPGSKALADYIDEHVAAFGETPDLFPPEGVDALARASRAAYARIHPLLLERARARPRPPHPRRSPSRQYRPARRPAGAVRCHRVQPADRVRRRALRSRIPADGSDRARAEARREHRAQPLSRYHRACRGFRWACNTPVLLVDARGDPRQGHGGAAAVVDDREQRRDRRHRAQVFRRCAAIDRTSTAVPDRRRRALRHRQIGAGARAGARPRRRARRRGAALGHRAQDAVRQGRTGKTARGRLCAGGHGARLCQHRRQGPPRGRCRALRHRRRVFAQTAGAGGDAALRQRPGRALPGLFLDADLATRVARVGARAAAMPPMPTPRSPAPRRATTSARWTGRAIDASGTPDQTLARAQVALERLTRSARASTR